MDEGVSASIKFLVTQGVLGVVLLISLTVNIIFFKRNTYLTDRLEAKSDKDKELNKAFADRQTALMEAMVRQQEYKQARKRRETRTFEEPPKDPSPR